MAMNMILRRDDFVILSDGSSMFEHVLHALGVNYEEARVFEVHIEVPNSILFSLHDEEGGRLLRVYDPNTETTRLESFSG